MTTHNDDDDDENGRLAITVSCPICVAKIGQTCVILSAGPEHEFHAIRLDKAQRAARIRRHARSAGRQ